MFDGGLQMWKEAKYEESIQNLIALTKAFPEHHLVDDSLFWIANIYEHYLENPDQAVRFYRSLTTVYEESEYLYQSLVGLARVRSQQGDEGKRKAIRIYMKLQNENLDQVEPAQWESNQLQLAQLLFDLSNYEQMRVELKRLLHENNQSEFGAKAYYLIGKSYQLEDKLELAELAYLEADSKFRHQKAALSSALSLADIYEATGQLNKAIAVYESILNRLERREIFYQLANNRIQKLRLRVKQTKTG